MALGQADSSVPDAMAAYRKIQIYHKPSLLIKLIEYEDPKIRAMVQKRQKAQLEIIQSRWLIHARIHPRTRLAKYERQFEKAVLRLPKHRRHAAFFYVLGDIYYSRGLYEKAIPMLLKSASLGGVEVKQMVILQVAAVMRWFKRNSFERVRLKYKMQSTEHRWSLAQRLAMRRLLYVIEHEPKQIGQSSHKWLMPWTELRYDIVPYCSGFRFVLNRKKTQHLIRLKMEIGFPVP